MFHVPGVRVLAAERDSGGLRLTVETDRQVEGCRGCGVLAVSARPAGALLHDAPFGHHRVRVAWRKRVWRCLEPGCAMVTFTETHALAAPRTLLTRRAVVWAADALSDGDATVDALARRLGVDWSTLWDALKVEAHRRADDPNRLAWVESLDVDEHIWRPVEFGQGREVTCMVDLTGTRTGRFERVCWTWCWAGPALPTPAGSTPANLSAGHRSLPLRSTRCAATARPARLASDAVLVLDAFHVVELGTQVVDEVRRRVQQEPHDRRGHENDPLYRISRLLRHGLECLTESQHTRLQAGLIVGDPHGEVELAWSCYQQLRATCAGTASLRERRALAEKVAQEQHPQGGTWVPGDAPSRSLQWAVQAVAKAGTIGVIGVHPSNMLTQVEELPSVLDACATFDQRESGWTKVALLPDGSARPAPSRSARRS